MTFILIAFLTAALLAVPAGLLTRRYTRRWRVGRQVLVPSLTAALISAPVVFGSGHGAALAPLGFAVVYAPTLAIETLYPSLPITWVVWSFVFGIFFNPPGGGQDEPPPQVSSD